MIITYRFHDMFASNKKNYVLRLILINQLERAIDLERVNLLQSSSENFVRTDNIYVLI